MSDEEFMIDFFKTTLYNPLYNILIFLAWLIPGHSIGWAIIILTLIIRAILLPSSLKSSKAQVKMQAIQPKINKIRKEIKDQQEQGRALMALYKEEGVSPFGSCLPLLIQMPIIIVLYQVFRAGIDESKFSLLYSFVPHPEKINSIFLGMDLSKPDLWILPILAGLSQFALSYLMIPKNVMKKSATKEDGSIDPMQMANKQMVYFFPIITIIFAEKFPEKVLALLPVSTVVSGKLRSEHYPKDELADWKKKGVRITESRTKPGIIKRVKWAEMEDCLKYDLLDKVENLTMPVLLIVGENDDSTPLKHQKILFDKLPGKKELHVIENAPHSFRDQVHLDEIKEIVTSWLRRIR